MPRKIMVNSTNEKMAIEVVHKIASNISYEDIANEYQVPKDFIYCLIKTYKPILGITGVISKYDSLRLSGEILSVVKDYLLGKSTVDIAEKYEVSDRTVVSWLLKEKVQIRDRGNISKINQAIFDNIETEIQVYTLGLITADGSVSKENATVTITLTQSDKYLLEIINNNLLDGLGHIALTHLEDEKPRCILSFNGKHIKERLKDFNIVYNKSYSLKELAKNIPENLYHHYIRGLFDGDGVCSHFTDKRNNKKIQKVRVGFCAHEEEFVKSYRDYLNNKLGLPKNKLFNTGGCWQCSWAAFEDIKKFYEYIYKDATVFLGRKKKKISDYINTEVN